MQVDERSAQAEWPSVENTMAEGERGLAKIPSIELGIGTDFGGVAP